MCLSKWCFNEKVLLHKWQLKWSHCLCAESDTATDLGSWKAKCWSCAGAGKVCCCARAGRFGTYECVCNALTGWSWIGFDIDGTGKGYGTVGAGWGRICVGMVTLELVELEVVLDNQIF